MDGRNKFLRVLALYVCLVAFCTSPIWLGGYFINQDGSAHVSNAWIMLGLLQGEPLYAELYSFNTFALPNSIGHWLLAVLLIFVSPFAATKIMVVGIFAATVAAAGNLRFHTSGLDGVGTSMLIGAAVSFNWLWLVGFYNFCIGVCIVTFTIAIFSKWRDALTWRRVFALAFLLLLTYYSHLVAVAALVGVMLLVAVFSTTNNRKMIVAKTITAMLPLVPLILTYRSVSASSDTAFAPVWRSLVDPTSLTSWLHQLRAADSFIIISRKAFPFIEQFSLWFTLFSPILWIAGAMLLLGITTFLSRRNEDEPPRLRQEYVIIFAIFLAAALFSPDDFDPQHGGIVRERILIIGLLLFIPIFRAGGNLTVKTVANSLLLFIIAFQTFALWDYSSHSNAVGREFVSAQRAIPQSGGIASITVIEDNLRYHSSPIVMINNLNGIGRNQIVWDNYALGHHLFPVILKNGEDKKLVYRLIRSSALFSDIPKQEVSEKLNELDAVFHSDDLRIGTLLVWGESPELDVVVTKHFEAEPFYHSENIRLYRRKQAPNVSTDEN